MYKTNPFTLMYGIKAESIIPRNDSYNKIISSFENNKSILMYLITGIRGCGKTVLLRKCYDYFYNKKDWIAIDLNPQGEILNSLVNRLYENNKAQKLFKDLKISINLPYVSVTKELNPSFDSELISEKIISNLNKKDIKILLTIDEVNNTQEFKKFVNFYQSIIGKGYSVFLLMTGLKENINSIINDKAMTFLSRSPKIQIDPLNLPNIALAYKEIFDINDETAIKMAKLTNGYAFAYQVLGYLYYEDSNKTLNSTFISKYDSYLWDNGYNKFWSDLTKKEKEFLIALSLTNNGLKDEILKTNMISESNYSQYRKRLIEKGI